jgi:tetratricopeptide (TPR) repeat protein
LTLAIKSAIVGVLGSSPEDDVGTSEGVPASTADSAISKSERANALAARIDAAMSEDSEDAAAAPKPVRAASEASESAIEVDDIEEVHEVSQVIPISPPAPAPHAPPPLPAIGRVPIISIPRTAPTGAAPRPVAIPSPGRPPSIPVPRVQSGPIVVAIPTVGAHGRTKAPSQPPPLPIGEPRAHPPTPAPQPHDNHGRPSVPSMTTDELLSGVPDGEMSGGVEVSTATPNIVVDQPLETHLESPTVVDRAVASLGDAGAEPRAEELAKQLDSLVLSEPANAAFVAYELGELFERRLADEARAVKAFGRAVNLDASLRPNLWAIRRVFYRRALWPNLAKLVDAEVEYARDDAERADLFLEKARVLADHMNELDPAREALDEAVKIAPHHQGALLELERLLARKGDDAALVDAWERLADAVALPARKTAYWLEVGRAAGKRKELERAWSAFDKAATIAPAGAQAERVARERLRVADEHGDAGDVATAIDRLAAVLLATFGPAGPAGEGATDRASHVKLELVALRRRQAQLARAADPERAWELLQQALALAPGESLLLADLTELAEELGRYEDLAELVQSWQAIEGDPASALVLSIRRADALLRGGKRDQARALLASLEASAPGFVVLTSAAERDALGRMHEHANEPIALADDLADLAKAYLGAAHAALLGTWLGPGQQPAPAPTAAAALFVQAAELLAYRVGTMDAIGEARAALAKAIEIAPDDAAAFDAAVELDDVTGNVGDAIARLRAAANARPAERRALLDRAARLARTHGDLEVAAAIDAELFALDPSDTAVAWRLESTYAQLGRDDDRAELLVKIAGAEQDAAAKGTALATAARLRERAGAVDQATELYRQVIAVWPDDTFARESLVDLLRAQERWPELVAERRAEARALPDTAAARRALREAAWVLEVRQDDDAAAAAVYDEWLARFPDDRAAAYGVARTRARIARRAQNNEQASAREAEVAARRTIAELDGSADAQWLHAHALERVGRHDDAAEIYRALVANDPNRSVAATAAAIALGDLASARGDTVLRVESTSALAQRAADPRLAAALAEDSGWMYALVLEDFDRAAQAFDAAIALDATLPAGAASTRRGALLGAALVAARRADTHALAAAYQALANAIALQMPEAAAALLLRASALAAATGDLDVANQAVAAARAAAPDDASALLVVAETGTVPTVTAGDPFAAVDPLLARAEVLEMRGALADDGAARASWELDRAEALELAGRLRESGSVIVGVLRARPDDLRALSALRRITARAGDKAVWAQASYALARHIGDRAAKLELLRAAASVFDGSGAGHHTDHALATYHKILQIDPGAPEHDRVLDLLRERADTRGLIIALTDRLTWLEAETSPTPGATDPTVPLLLERATVLHGTGDAAAAIADLDALLERAASHAEALRFRGDLALTAGMTDVAVELWRRYLAAEPRPHRRAEIELQLARVLAENTGDLVGAIEQLGRFVDAHPDDLEQRERLLALCLRASDWERAARELRALARMRPTPQEKAREELRLGLMLRDRLNDRTSARIALDRARALDPLNLDVVRELAELLDPASRAQSLAGAAASLRASIAQSPSVAPLYERLAQINAWQADVDARWVALTAVEALGTPSMDQRQVLAQGRGSMIGAAPPPKQRLDDAARAVLRGGLGGPLVDLWRAIAPAVRVATGVEPSKLGYARGDKVSLKKLPPQYAALAGALSAFAVDDVELYVASGRAGPIANRALAGDTPIALMSAEVAAGATPQARFQLGRTIATIAEGVATLPDLHDGELELMLVAALRAVDLAPPPALAELVAGQDNAIAERAKVLRKELSRRAKAVVQQIVAHRAADLAASRELRRTALTVGYRAGLLWSGDLGVALEQLDVGRGGRDLVDNPLALDLVAWSVGEPYLRLRAHLGVSLGGGR